jgi:phage gp36-like protein
MGYCTVQDIKDLGLPAEALEEIDDALIQGQIDTVQGVIDLFLASQYTLPLAEPYPEFLRRVNIDLAVCEIFLYRGFNPEEYDANYMKRCEKWMALLEDISTGKLTIPGVEDDTPDVSEGAPVVFTQPLRGW